MKQLLTVKEAAEVLSLTPDTIYRMTKTGRLPSVRIGRTIRIKKDDLDTLIGASMYVPNPAPPVTRAPITRL